MIREVCDSHTITALATPLLYSTIVIFQPNALIVPTVERCMNSDAAIQQPSGTLALRVILVKKNTKL